MEIVLLFVCVLNGYLSFVLREIVLLFVCMLAVLREIVLLFVCLLHGYLSCFNGDCPAVCVHVFHSLISNRHTLSSARRLLKFISAQTLFFLNHGIKKKSSL